MYGEKSEKYTGDPGGELNKLTEPEATFCVVHKWNRRLLGIAMVLPSDMRILIRGVVKNRYPKWNPGNRSGAKHQTTRSCQTHVVLSYFCMHFNPNTSNSY